MKLTKTRASDEIPTSSMADIAFLLIVYFMVTATFAATRGLDFALPKDDDTPPIVKKEESVLIEIKYTGDIVVDQKPMQLAEIFDMRDMGLGDIADQFAGEMAGAPEIEPLPQPEVVTNDPEASTRNAEGRQAVADSIFT